MAQVDLTQLAQAKATITGQPVAGGSFWTPDNINKIIGGIRDLMAEYQKLKGFMPGANGQQGEVMLQSAPTGGKYSDMQRPVDMPPDVLTMAKLSEFGKRLCDQLDKQGMGDKTIPEVLDAFGFTIRQIRGMIP